MKRERNDLETTPGQTAPDLPLKIRLARYNSPYLQLMLSILTARYGWFAFEDINPGNIFHKPDPRNKPDFTPWQQPSVRGYLSRNFPALGMGTLVTGFLSIYSHRTYQDIKTLYAEAVGYELNKDPKDVGWRDLYFKSNNAALKVTRKAFVSRSIVRFAASASFFVPWHRFRDFPHEKPKFDANMNAGISLMGGYLSVYEGFIRTPSYFDLEQDLMGRAAGNTLGPTRDLIQPSDILSLICTQRKHLNRKYIYPAINSEEGQRDAVLTERIADLLNKSYGNKVNDENAKFSLGKFNYLVGFGLLDTHPANLAYVELANRSKTMEEVKAVAKAIKNGADPAQAFATYGIDVDHPIKDTASVMDVQPEATIERLQTAQPAQAKKAVAPRSFQNYTQNQPAAEQRQVG